jgi:hypothetical protein
MNDRVASHERLARSLAITDVRFDQLGGRIELVIGVLVDLWIQRVENAHCRPVREEAIDEMRSDEAGATGDKDDHGARGYQRPSSARS